MPITQLYFSLEGRIGRQTLWLKGGLLLGAVSLAVNALLESFLPGSSWFLYPFWLWVTFAVCVKRWHDLGKTGWWVLITFIPMVGVLWALIELGFMKGDAWPNEYGEVPD